MKFKDLNVFITKKLGLLSLENGLHERKEGGQAIEYNFHLYCELDVGVREMEPVDTGTGRLYCLAIFVCLYRSLQADSAAFPKCLPRPQHSPTSHGTFVEHITSFPDTSLGIIVECMLEKNRYRILLYELLKQNEQ